MRPRSKDLGVTTDSFPYGFTDKNGQLSGFSTDILDAVARVMNLRIQRVTAPGRELHERFRLGEFALQRLTVDRRIQWENAVPGSLPPLYLNSTDLNQIIINLIINARDTLMEKLATAPS